MVLPSEDILNQAAAAKDQNSMSLEDLENDIFGGAPDADDLEATRKIDKFYTLYRKNEEFQKLLDAEYSKLQGEDIDDDVTDAMNSILGTQPEAPVQEASVQEAPQAPQMQSQMQEAAPQENPSSMSLSAAVNAAAPSAPAEAVQETGKKAKKKKAKKVKEEADYDEKGGSVLTVIAIVVAVLLVVLLGIILILNFAPESGIAQTLNEVIGNYTNFFADGGGFDGLM